MCHLNMFVIVLFTSDVGFKLINSEISLELWMGTITMFTAMSCYLSSSKTRKA